MVTMGYIITQAIGVVVIMIILGDIIVFPGMAISIIMGGVIILVGKYKL